MRAVPVQLFVITTLSFDLGSYGLNLCTIRGYPGCNALLDFVGDTYEMDASLNG